MRLGSPLIGIAACLSCRGDTNLQVLEEKPATTLQSNCERLGCWLSYRATADQGYCFHCAKTLGACTIAKVLAPESKAETPPSGSKEETPSPIIEIVQASGNHMGVHITGNNEFTLFYHPTKSVPRLPSNIKECRRHTDDRGGQVVRLQYTLVYSHRVGNEHFKDKTGQTITIQLADALTDGDMESYSWRTNAMVGANYQEQWPGFKGFEYQYGFIRWSRDVDIDTLTSASDGLQAVTSVPRNASRLIAPAGLFTIRAPPSFRQTTQWSEIVAKSTCLRVTCTYEAAKAPESFSISSGDIMAKLIEVRNLLKKVHPTDTAKRWADITKSVVRNVEDQLQRRTFSDDQLEIQEETGEWKGATAKCVAAAKKWLADLCPAAPTARPNTADEFDRILFGVAEPAATLPSVPVLAAVPKFGQLPEGL